MHVLLESTWKWPGSEHGLHSSPSGCSALEKGRYYSREVPRWSKIDKKSATVGGALDLGDHTNISKVSVVGDDCTSPIDPADGVSWDESHSNVHSPASFSDSEGTFSSSSEVTSHGNRASALDTEERINATYDWGTIPCKGDANDSEVKSCHVTEYFNVA